jgi:DNA-binding transcriptional ArsR family regulator
MGTSEVSHNQTQAASFTSIVQHLGERREELLDELNPPDYAEAGEDWDPRYTTAELRAETSVPQGSAIHHLERLLDWGLVTENDERAFDAQSGRETRVWEISERGMKFCDDYIDTTEAVSPEAFAALKTRVSSLEEEVAKRDEQLAAQERMVKWIVKKSDLFTDEQTEKILNGAPVE